MDIVSNLDFNLVIYIIRALIYIIRALFLTDYIKIVNNIGINNTQMSELRGEVNRLPQRVITFEEDTTKQKDEVGDKEGEDSRSLLWKASEAHLIVATLIITVTFTACIIMPEGFMGSGEDSHSGSALLRKKCCFKSIRYYGYHILGVVELYYLHPSIDAIYFQQALR